MTSNLTVLGFFKYFNFFIDSAEGLLGLLGLQAEVSRLNVILPVGISFYTFQSMSYTIDVYRQKLKSTDYFLYFCLFTSYFPQLVAGPIERACHLLPSLLAPRHLTYRQTFHGLHLILVGLFKKVAIADGLATSVEQAFGSTGVITSVDVIVGTVFFAIQIYCDFSGYSDIARGVSNLLGIELLINFKTPYFSKDPREFWQRWHISLSTWLRDYLYISLGGNRVAPWQVYRNLMVTMLLGGLWHGAAWNFVLWGGYQGITLCIHRWWMLKRGAYQAMNWLTNTIAVLLFQPFILYGWLLFRSHSLTQIMSLTGKVLTLSGLSFGLDVPRLSACAGIPILFVMDALEYQKENDEYYYHHLPTMLRGLFYAGMITSLCLGLSNAPAQFIYFNF
jgi:D-alanyl-lipoteichoic acid acyltransferase DltB (MBOAT superfamily)